MPLDASSEGVVRGWHQAGYPVEGEVGREENKAFQVGEVSQHGLEERVGGPSGRLDIYTWAVAEVEVVVGHDDYLRGVGGEAKR